MVVHNTSTRWAHSLTTAMTIRAYRSMKSHERNVTGRKNLCHFTHAFIVIIKTEWTTLVSLVPTREVNCSWWHFVCFINLHVNWTTVSLNGHNIIGTRGYLSEWIRMNIFGVEIGHLNISLENKSSHYFLILTGCVISWSVSWINERKSLCDDKGVSLLCQGFIFQQHVDYLLLLKCWEGK